MPYVRITAILLGAAVSISACVATPDTAAFLPHPTAIVMPNPIAPNVSGPSSPTVGPLLTPLPPGSSAPAEGLAPPV